MTFLKNTVTPWLLRLHTDGTLRVVYALTVEALFIGYLFFAGLFTIETLLPTFVTVRFSLTKFFFVLIIGTMLLSLLGRSLALSFSWNITKRNPLLWLGILWSIGILTVSLMKFPPFLIPILVALFLLSGYLFWNIFFEEN